MRLSRWLVPATVTAVVAGGVVVSSAAAGGAPDVPPRTAAQVLALAATSDVQALSGTVRTRADLGLPALPSLGGTGGGTGGGQGGADGGDPASGSAADPQAVLTRLLTGRTTLRVWLDGPQRQRVQLLDTFAEVAFVHDGRDVWTFDTGAARGTHYVLPDEAAVRALAEQRKTGAGRSPAAGTPGDALTSMTPQALAELVVSRLDPTTAVTLDPPQTVAGRAAYTLVVAPRTDATLVDRAVLAVDAATGLPLRVQVFARGTSEAVLESGFADIDYARPAASRFAFTPPKGADVTTRTVPLPSAADLPSAKGPAARPDGPSEGTAAQRPDVRLVGSGWAAVLVAKPSAAADAPDVAALLANPLVAQVTTPVDGGRALRTALFSVLVTDDGRVLVGAVPVETLVAAAR
ncbi:hypothetical protein [Kineosporia sp. R_H_3]|uniref:LolA family protein n=1 Tax=Kineosporia sp. R_H_3 TaxID=1961848 RepID=UPI000B4AD327|nr:hypothetical protein [Kineosporia sp. R_H_3]